MANRKRFLKKPVTSAANIADHLPREASDKLNLGELIFTYRC
jgi:hypothetical protein